jgi:hypothetical protein
MIHAEWIKKSVRTSTYYYSKHGDLERQNDNLSIFEIEQALIQGSILEQYSDTGRGESCLMVGFTKKGKPIHIVCGKRGDFMVVITVYIPSPPKFKTPFERG